MRPRDCTKVHRLQNLERTLRTYEGAFIYIEKHSAPFSLTPFLSFSLPESQYRTAQLKKRITCKRLHSTYVYDRIMRLLFVDINKSSLRMYVYTKIQI